MSKVKKATISFAPSGSPDVVGYKLYMTQAPDAVDYNVQSFDLGNATEIDLSTLPGMTTMDGVYNIGVTAVDDAGNESSMQILEGVALDFVAPDPPGQIVLSRE